MTGFLAFSAVSFLFTLFWLISPCHRECIVACWRFQLNFKYDWRDTAMSIVVILYTLNGAAFLPALWYLQRG